MWQAAEGIIDHVEIPVSQFERARTFYREALRPLGLEEIIVVEAATGDACRAGFGKDGYPGLWLIGPRETGASVHLALRASSRESVDAFHAHALRSGGRDNGEPGIRTRYHDNYYAAYVLDPDGNNIEAVCQEPLAASRATPLT